MKFTEIYERVRLHWTNKIIISDGERVGSGFLFPNLSSEWDKVEMNISKQENEWDNLMTWSMFKVIHAKACQNFKKVDALYIDKIDFKLFEKEFYKNLCDNEYNDMRDEYENDLEKK